MRPLDRRGLTPLFRMVTWESMRKNRAVDWLGLAMSALVHAATLLAAAGLASEVNVRPAPAVEAIGGTWVLQQVSSRDELERLLPAVIEPALATPHLRGFCLRVPWRAIDGDFSLLEEGCRVARRHGLAFSVRFMAGRHTPDRVFDSGCRSYRVAGAEHDRAPVPFLEDGSPNVVFERNYEQLLKRLAVWCRAREVRLLHLAWYGQNWAELNHGNEVRAQRGYSYESWLNAHRRLIDIGLRHAAEDLAIELPFSGHGPLTAAASALADHVVSKLGPSCTVFFCQANGWGPDGEWGAPNEATEAAFDRVWDKPICRGLQMIQPSDYPWAEVFARLYQTRATYCEVYAPSFTMAGREQLAAEIARFDAHCRRETSRPTKPRSCVD